MGISFFVLVLCLLQVSEQVDSLRVLFTDPVDYLVTPRVLAAMIAGPILNVLCFCMGKSSTPVISYGVGWLDSAFVFSCSRLLYANAFIVSQHRTNCQWRD